MRYLSLFLLLSTAVACEMDPRPPSYLDDLRILAVVAEPLEVGPDEEVSLEPTIFVPEDQRLTELSWTFCPVTLGSGAAFECAVPACELPLEPDEAGRVTARPLELAGSCPALAFGLPETFEAFFRLTVRTDGGEEREAISRIPVWTAEPPPSRNRQPLLARVEVDGAEVAPDDVLPPVVEDDELEVRAILDPTSLDDFVDNAERQRVEEPLVSFYATAGRFDRDRDIGEDVPMLWSATSLEPGQQEARILVVVRDLRGGQALWGPVTVPIER